ncbi:Uncharacterised protein [uncultured Flavonifractor sp.]|nr:Uncharacterised protein [uncultured Flavonifractor sp.]
MADEHLTAQLGGPVLVHVVNESQQGVLAATGLGGVGQMTLAVAVHHRLNLESGAHHGGGGRDASATAQVVQVLHGEPVGRVLLVVLHPGGQLLQVQAGGLPGRSLGHQQALTGRGGQGVHTDQLPVGVLLPQVLHADFRRLDGARQAGGEADVQHVQPLVQAAGKVLLVDSGVDLGRGAHLAPTHAGEELLTGDVAPGAEGVGHAAQLALHGDNLHANLVGPGLGQVCGGVSDNLIAAHHNTPLFPVRRLPHK